MDNEYNNNNENGLIKEMGSELSEKRLVEKKEKPKFAIKLASVILFGAVFGLMAGVVFTGVDFVYNKYMGSEISSISQTGTLENTSTSGLISTTYDVAQVAKNVMPSIVSITSTTTQTYSTWFENYEREVDGSGSGFIISIDDDRLLIVTNNHVITGSNKLTVGFVDDTTATAIVKGYDETADLAVIEVKLSELTAETLDAIAVSTLGDSDSLDVGEPAIAIGNALGYGQSVTVGYISALNRDIQLEDKTMTLLQTDAAINFGNSGGALLNINGEVIGINTVKFVDGSVEGMGYAIPISDAIPIINDLVNSETVSTENQAYLGIQGNDITQEYSAMLNMPEGIYVSMVGEESPAEDGGLMAGDIITQFNGKAISSMENLQDELARNTGGTTVVITVERRDKKGNYEEIDLEIVLGFRN